VGDKDPENAIKWAGTISDQSARAQSQQQVAASWLKTNPDAAKAWIAASDLPQDAKDNLLAEVARAH
jgi:ABC-type proline/glycine betaine transport system substrate-binding protein